MYHVHQLSALTINLWGVWICLTVFSVYIESTFDQKSGITNFSYIFLMLLLYSPGVCTADVSLTGNEGKLKLREFKMILANSLMRELANQHQQRGEGHLCLMLRSNFKPKKDVVQKLQFQPKPFDWMIQITGQSLWKMAKQGNVKIQVVRLIQE